MNTKDLTPDLSQAGRFLDALDPAGIFTLQTFDDDKVRKDTRLAQVRHGRVDEHVDWLVGLQRRGAGVFAMVNSGDGIVHPGSKTCRTAKNVIAVRALFVDLDGAPIEPVIAARKPDIVVESSPGRWHAYWLCWDCPLDHFKARQLQIAEKFGGDRKVIDLPRVLRLPGTYHLKGRPFMTRLVYPEA